MRPIYRIGSKGFTLLEVLIAVSVLIFGLSQIFFIFFESGSAVRHAGNRLIAGILMENAIWEAGELISRQDGMDEYRYGKTVSKGSREFNLHITARKVTGSNRLYAIEARTLWEEGKRNIFVSRERYFRRGR